MGPLTPQDTPEAGQYYNKKRPSNPTEHSDRPSLAARSLLNPQRPNQNSFPRQRNAGITPRIRGGAAAVGNREGFPETSNTLPLPGVAEPVANERDGLGPRAGCTKQTERSCCRPQRRIEQEVVKRARAAAAQGGGAGNRLAPAGRVQRQLKRARGSSWRAGGRGCCRSAGPLTNRAERTDTRAATRGSWSARGLENVPKKYECLRIPYVRIFVTRA